MRNLMTLMAWSIVATFALSACGGDESRNPGPAEPESPVEMPDGVDNNGEQPDEIVDPDERPEPTMSDPEREAFDEHCRQIGGDTVFDPPPVRCETDEGSFAPGEMPPAPEDNTDAEIEQLHNFIDRDWCVTMERGGLYCDHPEWMPNRDERGLWAIGLGFRSLKVADYLNRDENGCWNQENWNGPVWICIPSFEPNEFGHRYIYYFGAEDLRPIEDMGHIFSNE